MSDASIVSAIFILCVCFITALRMWIDYRLEMAEVENEHAELNHKETP